MSSVANEVRECVRRDPYLRETLARDVVSHAKLARWLRDRRGLSGSEHAIISALRRLDPLTSPDPLDEARRAIKRLSLNMKSGMVAITIERDDPSERRLSNLFDTLGSEVPVLPSQGTVTVIVPREDREEAIDALGRDAYEGDREGLALLTLEDSTNRAVKTDAILGLISHELGLKGVNIEEVLTSRDELRLLVKEADEQDARDTILALIEDDDEDRAP